MYLMAPLIRLCYVINEHSHNYFVGVDRTGKRSIGKSTTTGLKEQTQTWQESMDDFWLMTVMVSSPSTLAGTSGSRTAHVPTSAQAIYIALSDLDDSTTNEAAL